MTRIASMAMAGLILALSWPQDLSAQTLVDDVRKACTVEIKTYCNNVTPGEGRILACFYAHGDKIGPQCEYALFDAASRLERAVAAITYVANECEDEIEAHCANIQPGGGNIAQCLIVNEAQLGKACNRALADVGVK